MFDAFANALLATVSIQYIMMQQENKAILRSETEVFQTLTSRRNKELLPHVSRYRAGSVEVNRAVSGPALNILSNIKGCGQ